MEPLRQPIVLVDIDGDSITLNDAPVERTDTGDPWAAAIKAVAETVSMPLGRPVWALVSEPGGATKVAVHPDGSISHLEADEPVLTVAPVLRPAEPEPEVIVAPVLAAEPEPDPEPPPEPEPEPVLAPTHDELAAFLAHSARMQAQPNPRRPQAEHSHRGPAREHPVARRLTPVLGVAALVMVALTAALLVTMGDDLPMIADEPAQAADVKDVLPAAHRVQLRDRFPRKLDASVIPQAESVAIRINASLLPVRARIVLNQVNGRRVERIITLRSAVTRIHLEGLKPGLVDWVVRVAGARTLTGSVRVPQVPVEEPTSIEPAPTPPQEPDEPTSTPPGDPLTPIDPDEPTGPIDPDDL